MRPALALISLVQCATAERSLGQFEFKFCHVADPSTPFVSRGWKLPIEHVKELTLGDGTHVTFTLDMPEWAGDSKSWETAWQEVVDRQCQAALVHTDKNVNWKRKAAELESKNVIVMLASGGRWYGRPNHLEDPFLDGRVPGVDWDMSHKWDMVWNGALRGSEYHEPFLQAWSEDDNIKDACVIADEGFAFGKSLAERAMHYWEGLGPAHKATMQTFGDGTRWSDIFSEDKPCGTAQLLLAHPILGSEGLNKSIELMRYINSETDVRGIYIMGAPIREEFFTELGSAAVNVATPGQWHESMVEESCPVFGSNEKFVKAFGSAYVDTNGTPLKPTYMAALAAFDATVVIEAIRKAGTTETYALNKAIANLTTSTFFGPVYWDEHNNAGRETLVMQLDATGKLQPVLPAELAPPGVRFVMPSGEELQAESDGQAPQIQDPSGERRKEAEEQINSEEDVDAEARDEANIPEKTMQNQMLTEEQKVAGRMLDTEELVKSKEDANAEAGDEASKIEKKNQNQTVADEEQTGQDQLLTYPAVAKELYVPAREHTQEEQTRQEEFPSNWSKHAPLDVDVQVDMNLSH